MSNKNKKDKKIKVRRFWTRDPQTQIHEDVKSSYNRSRSKKEIEREIEEALADDEEDFDNLY